MQRVWGSIDRASDWTLTSIELRNYFLPVWGWQAIISFLSLGMKQDSSRHLNSDTKLIKAGLAWGHLLSSLSIGRWQASTLILGRQSSLQEMNLQAAYLPFIQNAILSSNLHLYLCWPYLFQHITLCLSLHSFTDVLWAIPHLIFISPWRHREV